MRSGYSRYIFTCGLALGFFLSIAQAQDIETGESPVEPVDDNGLLLLVPPATEPEPAPITMPVHVATAIDAIDVCHHWAGELDGYADEERMRRIKQGFDRDCPVAADLAKTAYQKSPDHPLLAAKILLLIDSRYYQVSDREKRKICSKASVIMQGKSTATSDTKAYYQIVCRN